MHLLNHFCDHICEIGNLLDARSELAERAMMDLKQVYRQSDRYVPTFHILWTKPRKKVFRYREINLITANQSHDTEVPLTKPRVKWVVNNWWPDIQNLDDLPDWYPMTKWDLRNYIAWYFKTLTDFTHYVDQDQYFSTLNDAKYILYSTVAIPVTSCQCDKQAVPMVHCSGSRRWRKHKPPRNDTVLLWMGTSPDSQFKSTAGLIPAQLKCHFIIEDAASSIQLFLALGQTLATGLILQTASMMIIDERHQSRMQPLHNGGNFCTPHFSVQSSHIVRIHAFQGV